MCTVLASDHLSSPMAGGNSRPVDGGIQQSDKNKCGESSQATRESEINAKRDALHIMWQRRVKIDLDIATAVAVQSM